MPLKLPLYCLLSKDDDGGCSVSRTPNRTIIGFGAFAVAVLGAWRLRRGQTQQG
jgi:MYXO-CTERM domain-containing protein